MKQKRDRGKFTIKLKENDPEHEKVIRLLESQRPHNKAQFIVDAILYYTENREQNHERAENRAPAMDRAAVEAIVYDVLRKQKEEKPPDEHTDKPKQHTDTVQTGVNNEVFSLVADTMSAFRSGGK